MSLYEWLATLIALVALVIQASEWWRPKGRKRKPKS
jgi:hypothetical protein